MTLTPFAVIWACLAAVVIGLALYRKAVTRNEDDYVHVAEGEAKLIPQQIATAQRIEAIDHWQKILITVAAIAGLVLAAAYLYQLWLDSQKPIG